MRGASRAAARVVAVDAAGTGPEGLEGAAKSFHAPAAASVCDTLVGAFHASAVEALASAAEEEA